MIAHCIEVGLALGTNTWSVCDSWKAIGISGRKNTNGVCSHDHEDSHRSLRPLKCLENKIYGVDTCSGLGESIDISISGGINLVLVGGACDCVYRHGRA